MQPGLGGWRQGRSGQCPLPDGQGIGRLPTVHEGSAVRQRWRGERLPRIRSDSGSIKRRRGESQPGGRNRPISGTEMVEEQAGHVLARQNVVGWEHPGILARFR